jgi:hypothetical protein
MPFCTQQKLHMPPVNIVQRFCTMLQASLSSHEQWHLKPLAVFSSLKVQRGTISQLAPTGTPAGVPTWWVPRPGTPIPCTPTPVRSIMTVLDITKTPFSARQRAPVRRKEGLPEARPSGFPWRWGDYRQVGVTIATILSAGGGESWAGRSISFKRGRLISR